MSDFPSLTEVAKQHRPYGLDCACGRPINSDSDWSQHFATVWREACTITTVEQLDALPAEVVVKTDGGSIACRHYSGVGVVFGDERPFPWSSLASELPGRVLWHPEWSES